MRETTEIFIPIPKPRKTNPKVEIDGDDLTGRIKESSFSKPVTNGIGTFKIIVSNAGGVLKGVYSPGSIVKLYLDNTSGTTLQFWGRIDNIKDIFGDQGQILEIEGRHRSYQLTESLICHTATSTETSQILKDIIDKLPTNYGFTYSNVSTTTKLMSVEWNYKPFWDCVVEICNKSGFDCYVDDDLDFHFFEKDSIVNTTDAVVEGDNLIDSKGWGINNYYEKTRVTVVGKGQGGLPIVYTAINPNEGDDIREIFINDISSNTLSAVQDLAESKLSEITNITPNATLKSFGLETIKPGENIWILIPRQEVYGQYKVVNIIHRFGSKSGGWRTDLIMEQDDEVITNTIKEINQKSDRLTSADNVNKFNYSWNFEFDDDSGTHSLTQITDGVLKTTGGATGTWISEVKTVPDDVSVVEIRITGENTIGTVLFVSLDNGNTYHPIINKNKRIVSGKNIRIKVELNSATTQIYSLVLLYS